MVNINKIMKNSKISNDILPLVSKELKLLILNDISTRNYCHVIDEVKRMDEEFKIYHNNTRFNIFDASLLGEFIDGTVLKNFSKFESVYMKKFF